MPSSVIRAFCYEAAQRRLVIAFRSGETYVYSDVPEEVADGLKGAFSKGRYFQAHIRDRFACRRDRSGGCAALAPG